MEQRSAEKIDDVPQYPEETVEAFSLAPHGRVEQRSPQFPDETVEAVTLVPRERVQQQTAEKGGEVPETASPDRRLQRAVEQAFVNRAEAEEIAECCFQLWRYWSSLRTLERVLAEVDKTNRRKLQSVDAGQRAHLHSKV